MGGSSSKPSSDSEDEEDKLSLLWTFKDRHGIWQKYGHKGEWGKVNITSASLEKAYRANPQAIVKFSSKSYNYEIDMGRMIQTNLETGVERPVRRKGGELVPYNGESARNPQNIVTIKEVDPSECDIDGFDGDTLTITCNSKEFRLKVYKVRAIDNPKLKYMFNRARIEIEDKIGSNNINLRSLYHCTYEKCALIIAQEGFDPKMSIDHEKLFGVGSYFTPDFELAHVFRKVDGDGRCTVIIADVIIGNHTPGEEGFNKAPYLDNNYKDKGRYNSCTGNLGGMDVNVVFKKEQVYPKFILTYTPL